MAQHEEQLRVAFGQLQQVSQREAQFVSGVTGMGAERTLLRPDVFRGEETTWTGWKVVMEASRFLMHQVMGEMMRVEHIDSAVVCSCEDRRRNQLYYTLLLLRRQPPLVEVVNIGKSRRYGGLEEVVGRTR